VTAETGLLLITGISFICLFILARSMHRPRHFRDVVASWPESMRRRLCSHRGYGKRGPLPENTLPAFLGSMKRGFRMHEMDVRISEDNEIILFHGPRLQETTSGVGRLEERSMAYLRRLDWGAYLAAPVPTPTTTLGEYLSRVGHLNQTNIELKRDLWDVSKGLEKGVARLINAYNLQEQVFFSSFHPLCLIRMRRLLPECGIGLLLEAGEHFNLRLRLLRWLVQPDFIHLPREEGTLQRIATLKRKGYGVLLRTINDGDEARRLFEYGADVIVTDNIDLISDF